jgi:hypothetical protein
MILAFEKVEPSGIILREFRDPLLLVNILMKVQVMGGKALRSLNPFDPLALSEIAVEVEVNALLR